MFVDTFMVLNAKCQYAPFYMFNRIQGLIHHEEIPGVSIQISGSCLEDKAVYMHPLSCCCCVNSS